MSKFWQLNEDPTYDDDGVLIDEDADWEDTQQLVDVDLDQLEAESFDPYGTVNS